MINPLQELSEVYLGSISEEDNSPEAVKGRVMQYVRAIRYRARKEGETLNKAYNDFMGGQSGVSSTEKQMVKERLGLTGGSAHVGEAVTMGANVDSDASVNKATRKAATRKFANTTPPKLKKESLSNWREDLREIASDVPVREKETEKKVVEKKINNKIEINPLQSQVESVATNLGGELLEMYEVKEAAGDEQQVQTLQKKQLQLDLRKLKLRRKAMASNKATDLDAEQKEKENTVATEEVISEKEVKVKDTRRVVDAIRAYDRAKDASRDATADTDEGKKKKGDKEKAYAKKERGEIKKDDPNWVNRKYHTGLHGESLELEDADGNLVYEVIDVIKAPALADIGEDLASVKATTYGLPHRERENAIKKYKEDQKKKNRKAKQVAKKAAGETVPATGALKKYDKDGNKRVRVIDAGYEPEGELVEKDLNAAERRALPDSDFALPGKGKGPQGKQAGSYPIPDEKHARSALSLVAQHGTPSEKAKVRAKVKAKFPAIFQGIKTEETDVKEKQKKAKMAAILARMQALKVASKKKDAVKEDVGTYEKKKTGEVLSAFKRDPKVRKRFEKAAKREKGPGTTKNRAADDMLQTAKDIAKRRGDTSKSDDRYAYESADPAFDKVAGDLKKKFGSGVLVGKEKPPASTEAQPKPKAQKPLTDKEKAHREVMARYGGEANYKAGRGLGT